MNKQKGQVLPLVLIALVIVLFTVLFVTSASQTYFQNAQYSYQSEQVMAITEAGIDKAVASLNATWGDYTGEQESVLGDGSYSVAVASKDINTKIVTVTGFLPSKGNPKLKRIISVEVSGAGSTYSLVKGTYQVK